MIMQLKVRSFSLLSIQLIRVVRALRIVITKGDLSFARSLLVGEKRENCVVDSSDYEVFILECAVCTVLQAKS